MHEMSIANDVLEAVREQILRYPETTPRRVGIRIGELTAVDAESLRFCFEVLVKDTDLDSLRLEIEVCPRRHRCHGCGAEFIVKDYDFVCPTCGGLQSECIGGDELALAYLEVDEHEPAAVGR